MSKAACCRFFILLFIVFCFVVLALSGLQSFSKVDGKTVTQDISAEALPNLGIGASFNGARPFPHNNPWNVDISKYPVHSNSANLVASIGNTTGLHPDFGTTWQGAPIGIPYVVVPGTQPLVPINFTEFGNQSDPGPYPVPPNAPIEGGSAGGDRHVLVIDRDNWKLYELYHSVSINNGASWDAGSGAIFDLSSNKMRPETWTSADAAGLPIFPGLVRYDEVVELGEIRHALRFTAVNTRRAYVYPARHYASDITNPNVPPMGMRYRLKSTFDVNRFSSPRVRVILNAMKKYGLILADNGSNWYISGTHDMRWNDDELSVLSQVKGSDFEAVQTPNHLVMPVSDFDGDGKTDISVFRPNNGVWYITQSTNNAFKAVSFGLSTDKLAPGDYDGDGLTDIAVYRDGVWYISQSSNNVLRVEQFGIANDVVCPAEFDGDGKTDLAVYRQGVWYIKRSTNNTMRVQQFGLAEDKTVVGDYDGDGLADVAVWRPSTGVWYIMQSSNNAFRAIAFGLNEDMPVVGDYDADGKNDYAVYRPSSGVWYVMQSSDNAFKATQFGLATDTPAPGDYDGDNRTDLVVYRPSTGIWYMMLSYNNSFSAYPFGVNGDVPIPSAYVR